jgi:anti-sigma factor RsiW
MAQLSEEEIRIYQAYVSELRHDEGLKKAYRAFMRYQNRPRLWRALHGAATGMLVAGLLIAVMFAAMSSYGSLSLVQIYRQMHGEG